MKPAAMKDGKLYSQQPHSGAGDFNFSRADGVQTRINKHGLIETVANNEPRLSYDLVDGKVSDCPHLLLEPSRMNLVTYSDDFSNWTNTGNETTDIASNIVSPDGNLNGTKLQEANSSFGYHRLSLGVSGSSSTDYSLSLFAKKGTQNFIQIILLSTANSYAASKVFDLENGVVGETITNGSASVVDSKIEDYGNGWYRCTVVAQLSTAPNTFRVNLANAATGNTSSLGMVQYTGDSNGNIFIWGAQFEAGSYPTSYIPTSGSTETRQADICNGSGNSETFNDSEGVLYTEIEGLANDSTNRIISISDGSGNNRVLIKYDNSSNTIEASLTGGGADQASLSNSYDILNTAKISFKYKSNDFALWVNGFEVDTDNIGATPSGLDTLNFDNGSGGSDFYGKVKELSVFNEALTDEQLQLLTTP